jgi:hypothetical protein
MRSALIMLTEVLAAKKLLEKWYKTYGIIKPTGKGKVLVKFRII